MTSRKLNAPRDKLYDVIREKFGGYQGSDYIEFIVYMAL
jgi:hypothetical protein